MNKHDRVTLHSPLPTDPSFEQVASPEGSSQDISEFGSPTCNAKCEKSSGAGVVTCLFERNKEMQYSSGI
jgi:hypothetical protein